jgi:glutamate N-acetyltransferase/amino-acid N-acetyltransferase
MSIRQHENQYYCFRTEDIVNRFIQCPGFQAAGIAAGVKKDRAPDVGLIYSRQPAVAAGVFTRNKVQAAPVRVTRRHIADGKAHAVIVNSGNANCCTGIQGDEDAGTMARLAADGLGLLPDDVMVASTGVIGAPMPMDKITACGPKLLSSLRADGFEDFARAIMTTDTVPKLVQRRGRVDGRTFTLTAAAKGAGMIRPDMATMLCFVCTDADITHSLLQQSLQKAVDRSLNCITIDGDTSTNDMVLVLANGLSGVKITGERQQLIFQKLLDDLLWDVARRLVEDGEGGTKVVEIYVQSALSDGEAKIAADTVAHSPLVKTAFFGEDANWGRIIAAVGRSGVAMDPDKIDIYFDDVRMVSQGQGGGPKAEARAASVLQKPAFAVTIALHQGAGSSRMLTSDFSVDYVKINADYRS